MGKFIKVRKAGAEEDGSGTLIINLDYIVSIYPGEKQVFFGRSSSAKLSSESMKELIKAVEERS